MTNPNPNTENIPVSNLSIQPEKPKAEPEKDTGKGFNPPEHEVPVKQVEAPPTPNQTLARIFQEENASVERTTPEWEREQTSPPASQSAQGAQTKTPKTPEISAETQVQKIEANFTPKFSDDEGEAVRETIDALNNQK